jgi:hypothetical protein
MPFTPTGIQSSTELGRSETVVFKYINISNMNIEKIFEILRDI